MLVILQTLIVCQWRLHPKIALQLSACKGLNQDMYRDILKTSGIKSFSKDNLWKVGPKMYLIYTHICTLWNLNKMQFYNLYLSKVKQPLVAVTQGKNSIKHIFHKNFARYFSSFLSFSNKAVIGSLHILLRAVEIERCQINDSWGPVDTIFLSCGLKKTLSNLHHTTRCA